MCSTISVSHLRGVMTDPTMGRWVEVKIFAANDNVV